MDCFKRYNHIWQKGKEEAIKTFITQSPLLSEFESQILYFQNLEQEIHAEPEYICVGPIALYTGRFIFFHTVISISQHCSVPLPRLVFQRVLPVLKTDSVGLKLKDQFVDFLKISFCIIIDSGLF